MRTLAVLLACLTSVSLCLGKDQFQASDFIKQQLNSIGDEQARATVKSRAVEGTLQFRILSGGSEYPGWEEVLLSEGRIVLC